MKKEKVIEVNLGIGMNMLFPETIKIVIEDDTDYEKLKKSMKSKLKDKYCDYSDLIFISELKYYENTINKNYAN
jgi:hypothetical protein